MPALTRCHHIHHSDPMLCLQHKPTNLTAASASEDRHGGPEPEPERAALRMARRELPFSHSGADERFMEYPLGAGDTYAENLARNAVEVPGDGGSR